MELIEFRNRRFLIFKHQDHEYTLCMNDVFSESYWTVTYPDGQGAFFAMYEQIPPAVRNNVPEIINLVFGKE